MYSTFIYITKAVAGYIQKLQITSLSNDFQEAFKHLKVISFH